MSADIRGQTGVDLSQYRERWGLTNEQFNRAVEEAHKRDAETRSLMSDPGALGLPEHLEARRLEYGITDGAFRFQPAYDRILVHQLDDVNQGLPGAETFIPGGKIVRTEIGNDRGWQSAPQGILVAAGLTALDSLVSHGLELGDLVDFVFHAPFRKRIDVSPTGHDYYLVVLQVGDLLGSADLATRIRSGECRVKYDEDHLCHLLVEKEGKAWKPQKPWLRGDY